MGTVIMKGKPCFSPQSKKQNMQLRDKVENKK